MSTTEIEIEGTSREQAGRRAGEIRRVARDVFGWDPLRPGIARAVAEVLRGHDVLGVMPTGYGKSAVYRIAGALLPGTTVVVSPLIALQADQLAHLAETAGARPARLVNSAQPAAATAEAWELLAAGDLGYLFLAPEQLANDEVVQRLAATRVSLLVVDEAHCVSSWGHDFRPDYLRLGEIAERLGDERPPILALTATGARPVREDILERLRMRDATVLTHGFDRPNIRLEVRRHAEEDAKIAAVLEDVETLPKPGLLYVATRKATAVFAAALNERGIRAVAYHGGLPAKQRRETSAAFRSGGLEVVVATSAFGMGIDKADLRFVVHAAVTESLDAYYQEVGRAGRDGEPATAVLHYREEDLALRRFFAGGAPGRGDLRRFWIALGNSASVREAAAVAGLSTRRGTTLANLFEEAGLLRVEDGTAVLVGEDLDPEHAAASARDAAATRTRIDESRIAMMRGYAETQQCRRQFLLAYFGDEQAGLCGNCDTCADGSAAAWLESRGADGDEPFPVDAAVTHAEWGEGTVMSVEEDRVTVFFDSEGYRVLSLQAIAEHDLLQRTD